MTPHTWRPYDPALDNARLSEWCVGHGAQDAVALGLIPRIGIVVDDILAVFLYRTDSSLCMIDAFIGDPRASRDQIKAALPFAVASLMKAGKKLGYRRVLGLVDRASTLEMAKRLGGQARDQIIVLDATL